MFETRFVPGALIKTCGNTLCIKHLGVLSKNNNTLLLKQFSSIDLSVLYNKLQCHLLPLKTLSDKVTKVVQQAQWQVLE